MKVPRGTFPKREVFYSKWVGEHLAEAPDRTMREGGGTVRLSREFRFSGDRLLDPNTCIAAINGTPGGVRRGSRELVPSRRANLYVHDGAVRTVARVGKSSRALANTE